MENLNYDKELMKLKESLLISLVFEKKKTFFGSIFLQIYEYLLFICFFTIIFLNLLLLLLDLIKCLNNIIL